MIQYTRIPIREVSHGELSAAPSFRAPRQRVRNEIHHPGVCRPNVTRHLKKIPLGIKPMLAKLVREPFHKPGWVYEEKYDGDRILAYKEGDQVRLLSRKAIDRKERFPHIVTAIRSLRAATLLLDGEMVVFDRNSISRFQLLQQGKGEPVYAVFDCLFAKERIFLRNLFPRDMRPWKNRSVQVGCCCHLEGLRRMVLRRFGLRNTAASKD